MTTAHPNDNISIPEPTLILDEVPTDQTQPKVTVEVGNWRGEEGVVCDMLMFFNPIWFLLAIHDVEP